MVIINVGEFFLTVRIIILKSSYTYLITTGMCQDQDISDANKSPAAIQVSCAVDPLSSFVLSMYRLLNHNVKLCLNLWPPRNESTPSTVCCMELKIHLTSIITLWRYVISYVSVYIMCAAWWLIACIFANSL